MYVVILAGGLGTRLSEETDTRPKPMVEVGGKPILWHIMKHYCHYGFTDFIICLGYKGYMIKEYFSNYFLHMSDVTIDLKNNQTTVHSSSVEDMKITLVDTGIESQTGGRMKRIRKYIGNETFLLTYGDGVSDVNIADLVEFHRKAEKLATITTVQPPGRFGSVVIGKDNVVTSFQEKPPGDGAWINGGFFVLEPDVFNYIEGDASIWEREPLRKIAQDGQLVSYRHYGFWKAMDTLRDKRELEALWESGAPPWKVWAS